MKKISFLSLFSILSIFACSKIELATTWADTYIVNQVDDYFDINSLQSQFIKKALKEDILVIRQKIFPRVGTEFQNILNIVNSNTPITVEVVVASQAALKKIFNDSLQVFEAGAEELGRRLEAKQIINFKKEFDKKTHEIQKYVDDPLEGKKNRYNKIEKQFTTWIGKLTPDQEIAVQKFVKENPFPFKEQIQNREKISKEFIDTFPELEKRNSFIHKLFYDYDSLRDANFAKLISEEQAKLFELISVVASQMTPDQKKYLNEILTDRIEQLDKASKNRK